MNIYDEVEEALEIVGEQSTGNNNEGKVKDMFEYKVLKKAIKRAEKFEELLGLYHKLLKYIGLYNSSTYCTKETRKDLKEKIKKTQTQIDELEKESREIK